MTRAERKDTPADMTAPTIIRPDVRVNEFGVKAFRPTIGEDIIGKTVEIRDWYATFRAKVASVAMGLNGYPSTLALSLEDGREIPAFSLNCTREIEIV